MSSVSTCRINSCFFVLRTSETQNLKNDSTPETLYWISMARFCPECRGNWQWREQSPTSILTLFTEKVKHYTTEILLCNHSLQWKCRFTAVFLKHLKILCSDYLTFSLLKRIFQFNLNNILAFCTLVPQPQPLSSITKRSANEKVMSRAGFINNVLTKIEEVWSGKGNTPQSSPAKR